MSADSSVDTAERPSVGRSSHRGSMIRKIKDSSLASQFDYVLVFPIKQDSITKRSKLAVQQMHKAGMDTFCYKSIQDDELIILVRCPLDKLKKFADEVDWQMELDPENVKKALNEGVPDPNKAGKFLIKPIEINEDPIYSPYSPYEHLFGKYEEDSDQSMYFIPEDGVSDSAFTKSIRLKLIYQMFRAPEFQGGCALEINYMLFNKKLLAIFPLHDHGELQQLVDLSWQRSTFPWNAPIEDFRIYFGEKIALYMVFMGHYSKWLIVPGILGMCFQLVVWATLDFSSPVLPFFSVIICIWGILMLEFWKRLEKNTALKWGMTEFEQEEPDRPEFKGNAIKSFITGKPMLYFPPQERFDNMLTSGTVVYAFVLLVLGVVTSIYVLRFSLSGEAGTYASTIASVLNTIQITVFNYIYQGVAVKLTDRENLRTDTEYEDSMIIKLFVFQFINSYTSFFFLAFIAQFLEKPDDAPSNYVGQCGAETCMQPLSINLAIIFGTRITLRNFLDIFLPYIKHKKKLRDETKGVSPDKFITPAERDYFLLNYHGLLESINNYADAAVQFGYSMLFVTALPCASFFSLVSNYYKNKFNAWKICTFYQRPVPTGAQDIGTWMNVFQFIAVAGVITNAGLVCFTQNTLPFDLAGKLWIFIAFQWVLIFVQFVASAVVPDEPADYLVQLKRMEFIRSKIIDKTPDEAYDLVEGDENEGEGAEGTASTAAAVGFNPCGCLPCCRRHVGKYLRKKYAMEDLPEVTVDQYPVEGSGGSYNPGNAATTAAMTGNPIQQEQPAVDIES